MDKSFTLFLRDELEDSEWLDGKAFQIHVVFGKILRLYPVEIEEPDTQCPVIVGGERCGRKVGHSGKHVWENGD